MCVKVFIAVSGKLQNNLLGSASYGQNLEPVRLSSVRALVASITHGVAVKQHARIREMRARSDVTKKRARLWISICFRTNPPQRHRETEKSKKQTPPLRAGMTNFSLRSGWHRCVGFYLL